jgi:hypothetical protein
MLNAKKCFFATYYREKLMSFADGFNNSGEVMGERTVSANGVYDNFSTAFCGLTER